MIVTRMLVRGVDAPLRRPLQTSARVITTAPLLLVDVETDGGITGHAYLFCYDRAGQRLMAEVLRDCEDMLVGETVDARALGAALARRWRLFGTPGAVAMALAGIDVALWDAAAQEAGLPLARMLGAELVAVPCYNSNGLGLIGAQGVAREAVELMNEGHSAVKLRLGYPTVEEDLEAVRAVRDAIGDDAALFTDYNQLLDRDEGLRRCAALDGKGVNWIEEPIAHDDYLAATLIAAQVETPIQLGENLWGLHAVEIALSLKASDLLMFDLQRIGGISGWIDAAKLTTTANVPLSSHLFPEVSVHLLAASPSRDRLEVVDWAAAILRDPLKVRDGAVTVPDTPGTGVAWDDAAVERYRC